jgi:hypothetical protein
MAPATLRVCHSNVASPQPNKPGWFVTTFTKTQFRMRAWHTRVSIAVIFMEPLTRALGRVCGRHQNRTIFRRRFAFGANILVFGVINKYFSHNISKSVVYFGRSIDFAEIQMPATASWPH